VPPASEEIEFEELRMKILKNSKPDTPQHRREVRFLATAFLCTRHERKASIRLGNLSDSPGTEEGDLFSAKAPTRSSESADLHGMTFA